MRPAQRAARAAFARPTTLVRAMTRYRAATMATSLAPSPPDPATPGRSVCRSERSRRMAAETAGCPYVKVPVPIQDTYSVAEIAILLRVSRNAVYEWSLLEDDPLPLRRMMGRKRGASRSGASFSSGASGTRSERCDLSGDDAGPSLVFGGKADCRLPERVGSCDAITPLLGRPPRSLSRASSSPCASGRMRPC